MPYKSCADAKPPIPVSTTYNLGDLLKTTAPAGRSWLWLILLIPYIALLWLPFYNDTHPSFAGFPFFYWYQFLWVPLTSLLIYVVYRWLK
jgi:hypothetical protein